MAEEISSLNETPVEETQSSGVPETTQEVQTESGQPPISTPTAQEIADWTKDERYQRMWKKDPNQMYKSYKSADDLIEKQYKPLRAQAESFTKLFKDYGYEANPDQLKSAFEELKTWKDPENPTVKRANFFSYFYDHPEYKAEVEATFENLRRRELQKQYPGMNEEQIKDLMDLKKFKEETESREKQREEAEKHKNLVGTIEQGWERVQTEAKKMGFPITEEIRQGLLDICAKEDVDPRFMFYKFADMYKEEIAKYQRAMVQADMVKARQQKRTSGIIPASPTSSRIPNRQQAVKPSMLDRTLERMGLKT